MRGDWLLSTRGSRIRGRAVTATSSGRCGREKVEEKTHSEACLPGLRFSLIEFHLVVFLVWFGLVVLVLFRFFFYVLRLHFSHSFFMLLRFIRFLWLTVGYATWRLLFLERWSWK